MQTNIAAGGTNQRRHLRPWIGVDRFPPNRSSYNEQNRREWWAAPCSSPPTGTNPCAPFWKPRWCLLSNPQQYFKRHKLKDPRYILINTSICTHYTCTGTISRNATRSSIPQVIRKCTLHIPTMKFSTNLRPENSGKRSALWKIQSTFQSTLEILIAQHNTEPMCEGNLTEK